MKAFPDARIPSRTAVYKIYLKFNTKGTVLNCNSKASPGTTHSGRKKNKRKKNKLKQQKVNGKVAKVVTAKKSLKRKGK